MEILLVIDIICFDFWQYWQKGEGDICFMLAEQQK
jgi:hypothetical protein